MKQEKSFGRLYEEAHTAERIRNNFKFGSYWWQFWDAVRKALRKDGDEALERQYPTERKQ